MSEEIMNEVPEAPKEAPKPVEEVKKTIEEKFEALVKLLADHGIHMG